MHPSANLIRVAVMLGALAAPALGAAWRRDCITYTGYISLGSIGYISPPTLVAQGPNAFYPVANQASAGVYQFTDCGDPALEIVYPVSFYDEMFRRKLDVQQ